MLKMLLIQHKKKNDFLGGVYNTYYKLYYYKIQLGSVSTQRCIPCGSPTDYN